MKRQLWKTQLEALLNLEAIVSTKMLDQKNDIKKSVESGNKPLCAVDLFAGAGGFSLGAIRAGFELRAAVEKDGHASRTYRRNIQNASSRRIAVFENDISDVSPVELMSECGLVSGDCDLLLGGPPCQGFSSHRLGSTGVNDPRNELLLRYFAFVKALKPRFFLVENVPGLLQPKHAEYLVRFLKIAEESDYHVVGPVVLNARDFGVPQNRKRVFILGISSQYGVNGLDWPPRPTHAKPDESEMAGLPSWRTAADAFVEKDQADDPNAIHMNHTQALIKVFKSTPANGGSRAESNRVLPCHKEHNGHKDVYGRIDPSRPSPTMTTACINPSKGRFVHPTEHHGITARQAARLQTFPDWFDFEGGLMAAGAQIGNAVPVLLAEVLCRSIKESIVASDVESFRSLSG